MDSLIGARFGSYEVLASLGHGGMGDVYRGLDTRLNRPVAIKASGERFGTHFEPGGRKFGVLQGAPCNAGHTIHASYGWQGPQRAEVRSDRHERRWAGRTSFLSKVSQFRSAAWS